MAALKGGRPSSSTKVPTAEASDKPAISVAYVPPTTKQIRFAITIAIFQFVAFGLAAPFAGAPMPRNSFVSVLLAMTLVADLVTAVLLFAQSSIASSSALLVLANGYLFSSLAVIPDALTFEGVLSAGLQATSWLYIVWRFGFLAGLAAYACLKDEERGNDGIRSALAAFYGSLAMTIGLVCVLTWAVIAGDTVLPRLVLDNLTATPLAHYVFVFFLLISVLVLSLVWIRRTSVLDLLIMVTLSMLISEAALVAFFNLGRFTLGSYVARTLAFSSSIVVLIGLLSETMRLYAQLASANRTLERERDNKLMTVQAALASVEHEIRQPLTGIVSYARAASRFLEKTPPGHNTVRELLGRISAASYHISEMLDGVRALFQKGAQGQQLIDLNEIILDVLRSMDQQFRDHGITTRVELTSELPRLHGYKSQLQEVVSNLLVNAVEAMDTTVDRSRVLGVTTETCGRDMVAVAVEDSGAGISPKDLGSIFKAFVTTKPHGTGLGLAITQRIVERHGGQITASSDGKSGALFQIVLPVGSSMDTDATDA